MKLIVFAILAAIMTGCASTNVSGYLVPGETLGNESIYLLKKEKNDEQELFKIVKKQLIEKGLNIYFDNELPNGRVPDIVVRYGAQWQWDITWYLLDFNVKFYDSNSNFLIASAQSSRTSLVRKEPNFMVQEALDKLFTEN